jgi:trigger factor
MPEETQNPPERDETPPEAAEDAQAPTQRPEPQGAEPHEEAAAEAAAEAEPAQPDAEPGEEAAAEAPTEEVEEAQPEGVAAEALADEIDEAQPEEAATEQAEEAEEEFDYGVEVEDAGTLKKKVVVTVPRAAIDAKREEMFGELERTAQVPGFRIGRAPRRLIEKRFGRDVSRDVRNAVIGESLGKAVEKVNLQVLGEPDLKLEEIELPDSGDMTYDFEVEVAPEFELPELKGIEIAKPVLEVTDERIDDAIDRLRLRETRYEATDAAAAEQDQIRGTAKIHGEGIGEMQTAVSLRVAPGQIEGLPLVDLGRELAGKKAGDTVTLTVPVPDVHPNESWRGKEATIELTLDEVHRRVLPEVNGKFAEAQGYESVAELREAISEQMADRMAAEARRAMRAQVREHLLESTDFELPEGVAKRHAVRMLQRRYVDLLQMGIPQEQIDERLTEIQAGVVQQSQQDLKLSFILQKIADEQSIEVTDAEIMGRVAQMAQAYGRRPERLRQELESDGSLAQVEVAMREEQAIDAVLRDAEVTEMTPQEWEQRRRERQEQQAEARRALAEAAKAEAPPEAEEPAEAEQTPTDTTGEAEADDEPAPAEATDSADDEPDKHE